MSDIPETTTPPPPKQAKMPPVLLLGGFLMVATAGSTFFTHQEAAIETDNASEPASPLSVRVTPSPTREESNQSSGQPTATAGQVNENVDQPSAPDLEQARLSRLLVGQWRQDYFGKRTLTVDADGTASMTILPSSVWAIGFGPEIKLTMFWSVRDGHLDYGISGGVPEDKVQLATKTWGDHWVEKIVALDEQKLDLLSVDGSTHSIWYRVTEAEEPTKDNSEP